jgi:hypothetical protein
MLASWRSLTGSISQRHGSATLNFIPIHMNDIVADYIIHRYLGFYSYDFSSRLLILSGCAAPL